MDLYSYVVEYRWVFTSDVPYCGFNIVNKKKVKVRNIILMAYEAANEES